MPATTPKGGPPGGGEREGAHEGLGPDEPQLHGAHRLPPRSIAGRLCRVGGGVLQGRRCPVCRHTMYSTIVEAFEVAKVDLDEGKGGRPLGHRNRTARHRTRMNTSGEGDQRPPGSSAKSKSQQWTASLGARARGEGRWDHTGAG